MELKPVRALRTLTTCLLACHIPLISGLLLCLLYSKLSQGDEVLRSVREAGPSARNCILITVSSLYALLAVWYSSKLCLIARLRRLDFSLVDTRGSQERHAQSTMTSLFISIATLGPLLRLFGVVSLATTWLYLISIVFFLSSVSLPYWSSRLVVAVSATFSVRPPRHYFICSLILLLIGLVTLTLVIASPVAFPRLTGSWAITFLAFGFWPIAITLLFTSMPSIWRLPSFAPLLFVVVYLCSGRNNNHVVREVTSADDVYAKVDRSQSSFIPHARRWLESHCDRGQGPTGSPCPMIFVAIEGGGIRSAYWSAAVLEKLNAQTGGEFYRHLFAISGVSGGSLGAFAFSESMRTNNTPTATLNLLRQDYLAPILGGLLFSDALQGVIPFPISELDNALPFEKSMEDSWREIMHTDSFENTVDGFREIDRDDTLPTLYLNTTNVETGRRFIITPRPPSIDEGRGDSYFSFDPERPTPLGDIRWSTAVSLSARFPLVSPPGLILTAPSPEDDSTWPGGMLPKPKSVIWGQLVDGGYHDNSGLETVRELVTSVLDDTNSQGDAGNGIYPEIVVVFIANGRTPDVHANSSIIPKGKPGRPADPPPAMMNLYASVPGKERVLAETSIWKRAPKGSDLDAPVETLFSSRDAKTFEEEKAIWKLLGDQKAASLERCKQVLNAFQRNSKDERFSRCNPVVRLDVISLADQVEAVVERSYADDRNSLEELVADAQGPGLGWSLSKRSFEAMDEAANSAVEHVTCVQSIESLERYSQAVDKLHNLPDPIVLCKP